MTEATQTQGDPIRFTRRVRAPHVVGVSTEAAALVRPHSQGTVRRPWQAGRAATPEPVVWVNPDTFHDILQVSADPVVIREQRGLLIRRTHYTTQYQGYYFTTRAAESELRMPPGATVVSADRVVFR